ncbi:hypothetical protein WG66_007995 [Moniliophthora roreri]|nr:hypothetical protein WG66_007995 [Moniliophthora roreri]
MEVFDWKGPVAEREKNDVTILGLPPRFPVDANGVLPISNEHSTEPSDATYGLQLLFLPPIVRVNQNFFWVAQIERSPFFATTTSTMSSKRCKSGLSRQIRLICSLRLTQI